MHRRFQPYFVAAILALTLCTTAWAQWSSDPYANLVLSDIPNADQVQPKVVPLVDNSFFVSWFNNNPNDPYPNGYDVYLQRLNAAGYEQFPHDGNQLALLTNGSTEDYGLGTDAHGNAYLSFLDTRQGANQQVTVTKIANDGTPLWGTTGIQLTRGNPNAHQPKLAVTTDGGVVVFWTDGNRIYLQKLDANGHTLWPWSSVTNHGIPLGEFKANYLNCDIQASDNGSVIISFSRDRGFRTNRYLYANKVSASGRLLWGSGHVKVFDGGSLQFGNFPTFLSDGAGGAVFAWYSSFPALQAFVQHINADGSEAFLHNGVPVSTDSSQIRVQPSASYNPATREIVVSWQEEDQLQSVSGVYAQKIDANGNRQWTNYGLPIVPLQANAEVFESTVQIGNDAFVFWIDADPYLNSTIQGVKLDTNGNYLCPRFPVSTFQVPKIRPVTAQASNQNTVIVFQDYRSGNFPGNSDITIQNINPDCALGNTTHKSARK